jgi:kalirin
MVNLEGISKFIDSTQLTSDLDGSLHYDHAQWIDIRLVSKIFIYLVIYLFYYYYYL